VKVVKAGDTLVEIRVKTKKSKAKDNNELKDHAEKVRRGDFIGSFGSFLGQKLPRKNALTQFEEGKDPKWGKTLSRQGNFVS